MSTADKMVEEPSETSVEFVTTEGAFTVGLFPNNAPETCEKFLYWCEGVEIPNSDYSESLYVGLNFYNIAPDKFIQTGDIFNQGRGIQSFEYPYERTYRNATEGCLFMAKNEQQNTNSSIFAVLLGDNPKITDRYTVFGIVTDGLDVCHKISNLPTVFDEQLGINTPIKDVKIVRVTVKRED
ncbi:MAG TPA: peptidylprolyl isomerase [Caldisericia bacterium]|nr:peptidylprolyl isomerase [Caldisericia bacterium]HPI83886.1 peptidylprolyl isomerase [Caldisericia bacterium]HPQ92631.1 peptidylprolyl isomerase [Caldisericia bacterium]HRV74271.1 peptidylprolyl isomerase [Caldisericia bacterium]